MKKTIHMSSVIFVLLFFMIADQKLFGQSVDEIRIKEYYWGASLNKVLNDFQKKYGIRIKYDSTQTAKYSFDDHGRFSFGTTVESAFHDICSDIPELSYYIDEQGVVHLGEKETSTQAMEIVNIRHQGPAKRTNIIVSGVIKDIESGETLPFATVRVQGTSNGTTTNADGYFTLFNVPTDTSSLKISYMGYQSVTFFLRPDLDMSGLTIFLKPATTALDEVVVTAERDDLMRSTGKVGVVKMSPKKMSKLPNVGETDIFRSFQLLPGVSGSNESSSGLFVFGGTPDQNLILYDGFTVYHVDHLFGMFSAFNPNAIKDVQLHKGGFESKFGGRISSVMEIVGKDGNENNFNIGGDIGFLSANIFTEIPIKKKLTILLAARRSWKSPIYNTIFDKFNESNTQESATPSPPPGRGNRSMQATTPSSYFYDLNAKVTYRPTGKDVISYSFFNGKDNLDNSRSISRARNGRVISGGITDLTGWGNWGMSTTWSRKWNDKLYTNALVSMSNYFSNRDRTNIRNITDSEGITTEIKRGSIEDNNLRDYTVKLNSELSLGAANYLEFGIEATHFNIDYNYTLNDTTIIQDRADKGTVTAGYLQDRIRLFDRLIIIPGLRASWYDVTGKIYLEPRVSVTWQATDKISLKGAWGQYYQFANRIIRNDISSGSRDFWVLADDNTVPVSYAEHFILGVSFEAGGYLFDVEGYYKNLSGLSEYSLQFVPSFSNIDYNEFFYKGTGIAKGITFLLQKKYGRYNGWIGYTLGEVLYDFPVWGDDPFPASHDVTHEFKTINTYEYKKWTFAATWIYATGKPYTEPVGSYTLNMLDGSTEDFLHIGPKNSIRYPDYHRLDVSVTRDFKFAKMGKGSIGVSIFNVYNRKNIWYKEFEVDEGELIETDVTLLGFTPSLTLSLRLR